MSIFALVDCDSFFASCEKIFRPDLKNKPVVVLSNNDGVIVARSKEAKALGFKMAEPYFKVANELKRKNVQIFSANFGLYSDISQRTMSVCESFAPNIEIYSIDEAFLCLDGFENPVKLAWELKKSILKWIGIPVSIGIAPTKTLAKLATEYAKHNEGIFNFFDVSDKDAFLKGFPVEDIWGVGWQSKKFFNANGILTAYDLKNVNDAWIKSKTSVVGQRTVNELRGIPCIGLNESPEPQKSIIRSRSFGAPVRSFRDMQEAISTFISHAAQTLRNQDCACGCVSVFINTRQNKHSRNNGFSVTKRLSKPTADTSVLINHAIGLLREVYKTRFEYVRAGVALFDLSPIQDIPGDLFAPTYADSKEHALMAAIDRINHAMGDETIVFGSSGIRKRVWSSKKSARSPNYTTSWDELPVAKAK